MQVLKRICFLLFCGLVVQCQVNKNEKTKKLVAQSIEAYTCDCFRCLDSVKYIGIDSTGLFQAIVEKENKERRFFFGTLNKEDLDSLNALINLNWEGMDTVCSQINPIKDDAKVEISIVVGGQHRTIAQSQFRLSNHQQELYVFLQALISKGKQKEKLKIQNRSINCKELI